MQRLITALIATAKSITIPVLEDRQAEYEARRRCLLRAARAYRESPPDCDLRLRYKTIQQWMNAVAAAMNGQFETNEFTGRFIQ